MVFHGLARTVAFGLSMACCTSFTGLVSAAEAPAEGRHEANVLVADSGSSGSTGHRHHWHKKHHSKKGQAGPSSKNSKHGKKDALQARKGWHHGKKHSHGKSQPKNWPQNSQGGGSQSGTT